MIGVIPRHARTPLLRVTGLVLVLVLTVVCAWATEECQRLSAHAIRAQIFGNVITDVSHRSHHCRPNGTLHAIVLAQRTQGTWNIKGHTLCLMRTQRTQESTTTCEEVWRWKEHMAYRDSGATVMPGFVRKAWR